MPARNKDLEEKPPHSHHFVIHRPELGEKRCQCGQIALSQQEFDRRKQSWDAYYLDCQQSDSAKDFYALMKGDVTALERVNKRCQVTKDEFGDNVFSYNEEMYMPKPGFPDPERYRYEII